MAALQHEVTEVANKRGVRCSSYCYTRGAVQKQKKCDGGKELLLFGVLGGKSLVFFSRVFFSPLFSGESV
jgi:hypothetical protein